MRRRFVLVVLPLVPLLLTGARTRAHAQGATGGISGRVLDSVGMRPLQGARVIVVGTTQGAMTREDGTYLIAGVTPGTHQLRASMIGFGAHEQSVTVIAGQTATVAPFTLSRAAVQLSEVVVVGYGTTEKRNVTGAVASVKEEQIKEVPTSDPMKAIQGRVPGVEVVSAGNGPGSPMNVRVRGVRSLTATNEPLYVVNGIPLSGGVQDFNPSDIASIEILKDASATAIYGSRGSNGVILITTKSGAGSAGLRTQFSYDGYVGTQEPLNLVPMMNAQEYAAAKREAVRAIGGDTSFNALFNAKERATLQAGGPGVDWQRLILRTGLQHSHQLGLNGSTAATRFAVSGNFFDQRGITINQGFNRAGAMASVDHTANRLRLGITANGSRSVNNIGYGDALWGEALANPPVGRIYDENGILDWKPNDDALLVNPLVEATTFVRQVQRNRTFASLFSELRLAEGLSWRVNFGPDYAHATDGTFRGPKTQAKNGALADATYRQDETFAYTLDNLLNYTRDFAGTTHHVETTLLYSIQKNRSTNETATAQNLPYDHQLWYNLGTGDIANLGSGLSVWALQSYMGRVNYNLLGRYLVTLAGRYDGSSRLAEGNKWAWFPSVGLGWHVGDEAFIRDYLPALSTLKLRGSFGRTGNTGINPYQTHGSLNRTRYNFGANSAFGYAPGAIPNPDLAWEITDQYDVGLELGLLRERITGNVDWYRQDTKDLLMARALPATSGFTQTLQNIGATRNTGIELLLSTVNLTDWHGLRWTSDINFTRNKNKIVKLSSGLTRDVGNTWFVGEPINVGGSGNTDALRRVYFDYRFAGVWQLADSLEARKFGQQPGEIRVADIDGDGRITGDDRVIVGNSYPRWTGSLYNRLQWRSLDASGLVTAKIGYTMLDAFGVGNSQLAGRYNNLRVNYWTPENPSNEAPRPNLARQDPLYGTTRGYRDGSHYRIRNITVGYTLPQRLSGRVAGVRALRVYGAAQDPYVFTDYYGYDPENGTAGGAPSYRTLLVGANFGW